MKRKAIFIPAVLILILGLAFSNYPHLFGKNQTTCANSITCINNLSAEIDNNSQATFMGKTIEVPPINLALDTTTNPTTKILGESTDPNLNPADKRIYIDLEKQKVYAFEKDKKIFETLVSTGKWGWTPTGEYKIWIKVRSQLMSGGSGNDYYYLPNVPWVMFFYNNQVAKSRGYSFHGAYWHNNFGHKMSHGCINMRTIDAKILYDWASPTAVKSSTRATVNDPGTAVSVCDKVELQEGAAPLCLK